jgi:hypothetical protein
LTLDSGTLWTRSLHRPPCSDSLLARRLLKSTYQHARPGAAEPPESIWFTSWRCCWPSTPLYPANGYEEVMHWQHRAAYHDADGPTLSYAVAGTCTYLVARHVHLSWTGFTESLSMSVRRILKGRTCQWFAKAYLIPYAVYFYSSKEQQLSRSHISSSSLGP